MEAVSPPLPLRRRVQCATQADVYAMQLCAAPAQQRVGVVCSDFALRLYDQEQLLFVGQCRGHTERVNDISAVGHMLVSASDDGARSAAGPLLPSSLAARCRRRSWCCHGLCT
jgi:hypothetical protein